MTPNGAAIRQFRQDRDLSLQALADLAGRDRTFLSRIERGLCGASEATLRNIATALNVRIAAINREERS